MEYMSSTSIIASSVPTTELLAIYAQDIVMGQPRQSVSE